MSKWIVRANLACLLLAVDPAYAACLTDQEIDAAIGDQIRRGDTTVNIGRISGRPLCSGLALAHQIQRMTDAAFPEETAARKAEEEARLAAAIDYEQHAATIAAEQAAAEAAEEAARLAAERAEARRVADVQAAASRKAALQANAAKPAGQPAVLRTSANGDNDALIANAIARSFLNAPRFAMGRQLGMNTVSGGVMNISVMGMAGESYAFLVKNSVCKAVKGGKTCTYDLALQASISLMGFAMPTPPPVWVRRTDKFVTNAQGMQSSTVDAFTLRIAGAMRDGTPTRSSLDELNEQIQRDRDTDQFVRDMIDASR